MSEAPPQPEQAPGSPPSRFPNAPFKHIPSNETVPDPGAPVRRRHRRPLEWLKSELAIAKGAEADKWSHRRGEPRNFAFLWAIYLMLGSIIALGVVLAGGIVTLDAYQPLSRGLVVTLAVGVMIFWPLMRLSQAAPEEGSPVSVLKDLAIVLIPLQAVIWPQMVLARWTPDIVLATSLAMIAWGFLIGGLLAIGTRSNTTWRSAWMAVIVALVVGGATISVLVGQVSPDLLRPRQPGAAPVLVLASGAGLVADISADRSWSGSWALVLPEHWRAIWCTLAIGGVVWIVAAIVIRHGRSAFVRKLSAAGPGEIAGLDSGIGSGAEGSDEQPGLRSVGTVHPAPDATSNGK
ncbi:MAG: hypothetical protein KF805_06095 [Phycisphaeraceae bacterium]|nr:hypothetical protein [Phycisphaeraceae bacterium]